MQRIYTTPQQRMAALKENEYFNQLDTLVLQELSEEMCLCTFEPGEVLFWDGDPYAGLHILVSGSVKLFKVATNGRKIILRVLEKAAQDKFLRCFCISRLAKLRLSLTNWLLALA